MDYEKKYNDALNLAKSYYGEGCNEFLDTIFPELHESEDERIRREIIDFICRKIDRGSVTKEQREKSNSWLAWLEKQKESLHIPETCKEKADSFTDEDERIRKWLYDYILHCPNENFEFYGNVGKEAVLAWLEKQKEQKDYRKLYDDIAKSDWFKKAYHGKSLGVEDEQKEQKPVEWSDNFEDNIRTLLHDKLTWHSEDGNMSSTVFIDDKTLKDIISGIWFYVGKEALKYPNKELNVPEWSEEDEDMIGNIICILQKDITYTPPTRPNSCTDSGNAFYTHQTEIDWLKAIRPQPHWKPSEEQMGALKRASTNEYLSAKQFDILVSLYEQLKKL